jgi:N-acetylglucosamine-6-sulfatase
MNKYHKLLEIIILFFLLSCKDKNIEPSHYAGKNILVIITDDQRFDALSVIQNSGEIKSRYPWIKTPNLDRLAKESTLFTNAFVTTSLCSPSRAAILTGQYNHINGIESNNTEFNQSSFATILQAAGYETAYFGKWHMGQQRGKREGFDEAYNFIGQGQYFDAEFERNGALINTKGWVDEVSTNFLLNKIRSNHSKPFCYIIGYKSSHAPWDEVPSEFKNLYSGEKPELTQNIGIKPIFINNPDARNSKENYWSNWMTEDLNYFRNLTAVDVQIGRLLATLEDEKLADSTAIIFLSDNGIYQGEHYSRDKRTAYEESIRIPMIIKKTPSGNTLPVCRELVLNIDIAPTILNIAGLQIPENMQGKSLIPLINGELISWRQAFVYHYKKEINTGIQTDITALRTKTYKLINYSANKDWTEFYNIIEDQYETNNLAGSQLQKFYADTLKIEKDKISLR